MRGNEGRSFKNSAKVQMSLGDNEHAPWLDWIFAVERILLTFKRKMDGKFDPRSGFPVEENPRTRKRLDAVSLWKD